MTARKSRRSSCSTRAPSVLDNELLTTKELYGWLAGAPPRLAIINACRTANLSDIEGTWAVADALVDAEVAGVIGMQGEVRGRCRSAICDRTVRRAHTRHDD